MSLLTDKAKLLTETNTLAIAAVVEVTDLLKDLTVPEIAYQIKLTLPPIADTFSTVASTIGAQYYNDARAAANVQSEFTAQAIDVNAGLTLESSIGYSIARLDKTGNYDTFQSILAGSMQRVVSQGDRLTIEDNIFRDPDGQMYQRVAGPNACAFCLTMAAVVRLQRSADSKKYHDFCRCQVQAVFTGQSEYEGPEYQTARNAYNLATKELQRQRDEVGYLDIPRKQRLKQYPDLALTTKNHLRLVRQVTGWN